VTSQEDIVFVVGLRFCYFSSITINKVFEPGPTDGPSYPLPQDTYPVEEYLNEISIIFCHQLLLSLF